MPAGSPHPEQETLDDIYWSICCLVLMICLGIKETVKGKPKRKQGLNTFYYTLLILPSQKPSFEEDVQDIPHFVKQQLLIQPEN